MFIGEFHSIAFFFAQILFEKKKKKKTLFLERGSNIDIINHMNVLQLAWFIVLNMAQQYLLDQLTMQ